MERHAFKEWASSIEATVDKKLSKWLKGPRIENGEAIHYGWQYEQTHMLLDIFWEDGKETVSFTYVSPRTTQRFTWHGLDANVEDRIMDRVGNLAMSTLHPYQDQHRRKGDGQGS